MSRRLWATMGVASAFVMASAGPALAEGDETLGAPSIEIASGSGIAAGGVGTYGTGEGTIEVTVPDGVEIRQVLLYWEGQTSTGYEPDAEVTVGGTAVTGTPLSSAPIPFYPEVDPDVSSSAYRADITELGLIQPGANSVDVSDLEFIRNNGRQEVNIANGAGPVGEAIDRAPTVQVSEAGVCSPSGTDSAWTVTDVTPAGILTSVCSVSHSRPLFDENGFWMSCGG